MHISLIGLCDSKSNIFPKLGVALAKKISGVEISERFAPMPEDIPMIALEETQDSDFIIVFAPIDDDNVSDFIKKKLVDVELTSKTRILKITDSSLVLSEDDNELLTEDECIVGGIVKLAVNILFNERAFEPKSKSVE